MADSKRRPNVKKINYWLDNIQKSMNSMYRNTYYSDKSNTNDMNDIVDDIENNISSILRRNNSMDISGISKLYSKSQLNQALNDKDLEDRVKELFEDNPLTDELLSSYIGNKWIEDLDNEIDTVLKYCTKMKEALELLRDAVLSADSFSKDFINPKSPFAGDDNASSIFQSRIETIIKNYKLQSKLQEWYDEASRYGEQYLYIVPYKKAIARLMNTNNSSGIVANVHESTTYTPERRGNTTNYECEILTENVLSPRSIDGTNENNSTLKVEFDTRYILASCVSESKTSEEIITRGSKSIYESYIDESVKNKDARQKNHLDISIPDDLEVPKDIDKLGRDGLVYNKGAGNTIKPNDLKIKGAIVKRLKRKNLIPLYIEDDICLGYYYLEFDREIKYDFYTAERYGSGNVSQSISSAPRSDSSIYQNQQVEEIIMHISSQISANLDKNFINANQDLTKEIYAILKSNDIFNKKYKTNTLKISFLPEEDVVRLAFNIDPDTHRGISDCAAGLIPAKLFSCLYITNTIGQLTRGQDKRVYYVKQTVDTNISQTLMNVINQIKKSNFGIRQIESINSILNITGRFNDYVIPVGPSGDSPVQFEVMPGQQFEPNSDLMNILEEMAVNSTNCPIELVQSRNSLDFATQFTSSSIKVLRFVYGRQGIVQEFIGEVLTKIYNCEYEDMYTEIECELPPPMFLSLSNTSQMLQNAQEYANAIADYEYNGDTSEDVDQKKALFVKKYIRLLLSSYVKSSTVDKLKNVVEMELKTAKPASDTTVGSGEDNTDMNGTDEI